MSKLFKVSFLIVTLVVLGSVNAYAECSADNQATYNTCVSSSATTCASSLTSCDDTVLKTTNSAALVGSVVTKCCAKSKQKAQLTCANAQVARLNLGRAIIPSFYGDFRRTSTAALKELKTLIKAKTICSSGSN